MAGRTLLETGNRDCPECGETKERLSRHWSACEFPSVDGDLRALLTGILLGGGTLQGNGEDTKHLLVITTSRDLAEWLFSELGWLAHSLRRVTSDGVRKPMFHVRTHSHTYLRRLRDGWYRDGEKHIQADASLTARSARVWWALGGGLEWVGDYNSQVRGVFSAEADARADAITSVLETAGFDSSRLDNRVCLFADELRDWLAWAEPPVPGVEHKWVLDQAEYRALREDSSRGTEYRVALCRAALDLIRKQTDEELTPTLFDERMDAVDADTVAETLGGGLWDDALSVAGVEREVFVDGRTRGHSKGGGDGPPDWWLDEQRTTEAERDAALEAAADEMGEPLEIADYDEWRADNPDAPSSGAILEHWGWSDACIELGIEPGRTHGHTFDDLLEAVRRVRKEELEGWPTVGEYTEFRHAHEPSVPWFYAADTYGWESWTGVLQAARGGRTDV